MIVCISYYIILRIRSDHLCVLICVWEIRSDIRMVRLSAPPLTIVYLSFSFSFTMPPKKLQRPDIDLSPAEHMLLLIAARINTAIRYKEANPDEDYSHYHDNLLEEAVSTMLLYSSCILSNIL